MIKKIAHLSDIHIRKSTLRHSEYKSVFNNLIINLEQDKPDKIVIVGDLFHDYIKLEGELLILASEFLNNLTKIAPVIITRGNHDIARSTPNRIDAIEALVTIMNNSKISYLNRTDMFDDENIVWCVWKHGEKRNNPWTKNFIKDPNKTYIDLFHDEINNASNPDGYVFNSKTYRNINDFNGDICFFGHLHKLQFIDINKTKAYSSSLIEQDYSEGNNQFHGYLLWDVTNRKAKEVSIHNDYAHYTLDINRFTDFDNLNLDILNPAINKRIRIKWKTLPAVRNTENIRKVDAYIQNKFNPISIKHINEFIEDKKISIDEKSDIQNINKRETIHKIIKQYLEKIGVKNEIINDVLELDGEIENRLHLEEITNIQWDIIKLKGKNFRSYDDIEIDWNNNGLFQIVGENGVGKSTINQLITYILFGKSLETDFRKKFGDARFINNKLNTDYCYGEIVIEANGEYYGIKRSTQIKKNKEGELTSASTIVSYYKLNSSKDNLDDITNIEKLNEQDHFKTQERINEIIGSYENYIRVTLTTSDTLNNILSSDKAIFIDSLLFDSGLNIFDLRLKEFKKYKEELIHEIKFNNFNINEQYNLISSLTSDVNLKNEFINLNKIKIDEFKNIVSNLNINKFNLLQSIHQIDVELSNTNEVEINSLIKKLNDDIILNDSNEKKLIILIESLKKNYDNDKLLELQLKKDNHKNIEFEKRTNINKRKINIEQLNSSISKLNGDIEQSIKEGKKYKLEIENLENSKTCPTCGQIKIEETILKIKETIKEKEKSMFSIADTIKNKKNEILSFQNNKKLIEEDILNIESIIKNDSIEFQNILELIGKLSNDKIEVEKRERLLLELPTYALKKENLLLKINEQEHKLIKYNDQKLKIEENIKIKKNVTTLNNQIDEINKQIEILNNSISNVYSQISILEETIKSKEDLIIKYIDYERKEEVRKIYSECIHRDGLPTQILIDTLLPNINNILSNLLESTDFDVYLDKDDLRLKLFYNNHPNAIIDCISASGMERTFAVYALKIALNQINNKSKSTLLTVDEIMGKLKNDSVDKFIELLHLSKKYYKKVLIIEPTHEVNADYLFNIEKNNNHISKLLIN